MEIWKPIYLFALPLCMTGFGVYLIDVAEKKIKLNPWAPDYFGKSVGGSFLALLGTLGLIANAIVWTGG